MSADVEPLAELLLDVGLVEAVLLLDEQAPIATTRLSVPTTEKNLRRVFTWMTTDPLSDLFVVQVDPTGRRLRFRHLFRVSLRARCSEARRIVR